MSREGQTEKWQSKELDSSYAQNQWWKWTELKKKEKKNYFGTLEIKGIQQFDKHLLRINKWTLDKNNLSLWHFSLGGALILPQLPSSQLHWHSSSARAG